MKGCILIFLSLFVILIVVAQPVKKLIDNANTNITDYEVSRSIRSFSFPRRHCGIYYYYDEEEGRCIAAVGGGKALYIDRTKSCGINVLKPHCSNPRYYYICKKGKTILAQCPNNRHFEDLLQKCIFVPHFEYVSVIVQPNSDASQMVQLPDCKEAGSFAVPGDCSLFYTCMTFEIHQTFYRCPKYMAYDPEAEMCSPSSTCEKSELYFSCSTSIKGENITLEEAGKLPSLSKPFTVQQNGSSVSCATMYTTGDETTTMNIRETTGDEIAIRNKGDKDNDDGDLKVTTTSYTKPSGFADNEDVASTTERATEKSRSENVDDSATYTTKANTYEKETNIPSKGNEGTSTPRGFSEKFGTTAMAEITEPLIIETTTAAITTTTISNDVTTANSAGMETSESWTVVTITEEPILRHSTAATKDDLSEKQSTPRSDSSGNAEMETQANTEANSSKSPSTNIMNDVPLSTEKSSGESFPKVMITPGGIIGVGKVDVITETTKDESSLETVTSGGCILDDQLSKSILNNVIPSTSEEPERNDKGTTSLNNVNEGASYESTPTLNSVPGSITEEPDNLHGDTTTDPTNFASIDPKGNDKEVTTTQLSVEDETTASSTPINQDSIDESTETVKDDVPQGLTEDPNNLHRDTTTESTNLVSVDPEGNNKEVATQSSFEDETTASPITIKPDAVYESTQTDMPLNQESDNLHRDTVTNPTYTDSTEAEQNVEEVTTELYVEDQTTASSTTVAQTFSDTTLNEQSDNTHENAATDPSNLVSTEPEQNGNEVTTQLSVEDETSASSIPVNEDAINGSTQTSNDAPSSSTEEPNDSHNGTVHDPASLASSDPEGNDNTNITKLCAENETTDSPIINQDPIYGSTATLNDTPSNEESENLPKDTTTDPTNLVSNDPGQNDKEAATQLSVEDQTTASPTTVVQTFNDAPLNEESDNLPKDTATDPTKLVSTEPEQNGNEVITQLSVKDETSASLISVNEDAINGSTQTSNDAPSSLPEEPNNSHNDTVLDPASLARSDPEGNDNVDITKLSAEDETTDSPTINQDPIYGSTATLNDAPSNEEFENLLKDTTTDPTNLVSIDPEQNDKEVATQLSVEDQTTASPTTVNEDAINRSTEASNNTPPNLTEEPNNSGGDAIVDPRSAESSGEDISSGSNVPRTEKTFTDSYDFAFSSSTAAANYFDTMTATSTAEAIDEFRKAMPGEGQIKENVATPLINYVFSLTPGLTSSANDDSFVGTNKPTASASSTSESISSVNNPALRKNTQNDPSTGLNIPEVNTVTAVRNELSSRVRPIISLEELLASCAARASAANNAKTMKEVDLTNNGEDSNSLQKHLHSWITDKKKAFGHSVTVANEESATAPKLIHSGKTISKNVALPIASAVLNITDKFERHIKNILSQLILR